MGLFDRFKKRKEGKAVSKEKKLKTEEKIRPLRPTSERKGISKKEAKSLSKEKIKKVKKEDTGEAYRLLLKPLLTEKATNLGKYGQYVFAVASDANKIEIKKAIYDLYGVEAVKVNVVNQRGKAVQYGRSKGRTKSWKKAIITLKPGEKIEIYEGV